MIPFLAIAWFFVVALALFHAIRQYRGYEILEPAPAPSPERAQPLSIVIPARDEAHNIGRSLASLLCQTYPAQRLAIFVVDDNSSDGTAAIVGAFAAKDSRVHLIRGKPLPEGWAGKPHACWQGAMAAGGQWLCFIDADTVANPALLSTAMRVAEDRRLDMLSLEPFQELGTFWERLIMPAGFFLLAFCHDMRQVNDPTDPRALANGQFILIRRSVYEELGGHAGVRDEITEDTALARKVKGAGRRLAVLGAERLIRTRMYLGLSPLWEGLSKNLTQMIGGIPATVAVAAIALIAGWTCLLLPLLAWFAPGTSSGFHYLSFTLAALASLAFLGTHIGTACYFGIPWWYGALFPLSYTAGTFLALHSIWTRLRGRVPWKGRIYPGPAQGAGTAPSPQPSQPSSDPY